VSLLLLLFQKFCCNLMELLLSMNGVNEWLCCLSYHTCCCDDQAIYSYHAAYFHGFVDHVPSLIMFHARCCFVGLLIRCCFVGLLIRWFVGCASVGKYQSDSVFHPK
jgi:hypothetical protein